MKSFSVGSRLYISILSVFLLYALTFMFYQRHREREYRVTALDERLQDFNATIDRNFHHLAGTADDSALDRFISMNGQDELRVTLIRPDGTVVFDSDRKDYASMPNHADRPEIREALKTGHGRTVDRRSSTLPQSYFYSATYFPDHGFIVRSALPWDENLAGILATGMNYLWFSIIAFLLLTLLLYRFIHRLGTNITKLKIFAWRADHNETLDVQDLSEFPDDELGEIAERIIKMYKRYRQTRQEQDELKRQLTHNIAHELKTPVASIQGYLETIIEHPDLDKDTLKMFLGRSYAQSQRLTALLQDISALNRMDEMSDAYYPKEEVSISRMVADIAQETALQFSQKQMTFVDRLPDGITVHGVRSLLYSIFRNLTDNALAYAGQGTQVVVSATQAADGWDFTFYDTGRGVPAEHLQRLFERFYRVDKGRSRNMGGTGLGLAIVKNAVLLHHGTIKVSNRDGGGLQFQFSIHNSAQ